MNKLLFLLQKEFKQIFRNPTILRMIIIMPILQLIILPLAADYEVKIIMVSVVDLDHSPYSNRLIQKMLASKAGGNPTAKPEVKKPRQFHCASEGDIYSEETNHEHND